MPSGSLLPDDVARHAGLTMMQAASIASVLEGEELICPFAIVARGDDRDTIAFESETQEQAVAKGWASLDDWREKIDLWAFAREGLMASEGGKVDVLVVAAWGSDMAEPAMLIQQFLPKKKGGFTLLGPLVIQGLPESELPRAARSVSAGIEDHPKGHQWHEWKNSAADTSS